jgi:hypothetical protein
VGFVLQEHPERVSLSKEHMVRCGSLMKGACLATWQTEIHDGIAEWDTQRQEPSVEQLLSGDPLQ